MHDLLNKKILMQSLYFLFFIVALIFLFIIVVNINIVAKNSDSIFSVDELIEFSDDFDCILILGAGVKSNGSPTDMLRDRLLAGFEGHKQFKNIPILLSGDSENSDYQETVAMKTFLLDKGVKENDIICDGYGLSTYESIWRAKNIYGYNKILIVSQKYHLHRAIYIANELGITAFGIDSAFTDYRKQAKYTFREYLARVKDVFYSEMRPEPKYTDKWEGIYE